MGIWFLPASVKTNHPKIRNENSMSLSRGLSTLMFVSAFVVVSLLGLAQAAQAQTTDPKKNPYTGSPPNYEMYLMPIGVPNPNPEPHYFIPRPRVPQPKIPYPVPIDPRVVANQPLPAPSVESLAANKKSTVNKASVLATSSTACLDFEGKWGSEISGYTPWDNQYAGWGPYAVDDGGLYQIENVFFTKDTIYASGRQSAKIHSDMPYSAGLASPTIPVDKGTVVTVTVNYFIRNGGGAPVDWVTLGVKEALRSANCGNNCSVNGYVHGQWATLSKTITAPSAAGIIVRLQASSPGNIDSNISFDNVEIRVGDKLLKKCGLDEDLKDLKSK